jgi:hypothetical protein
MAQLLPIETDRACSVPLQGLTSGAARRLVVVGPNAIPDTAAKLWRMAFTRFWAPVPWMLKLTVVVELLVGDPSQAAVFPPVGVQRNPWIYAGKPGPGDA